MASNARAYCCPWFEKSKRLTMACDGARVEFTRRSSLRAWTTAFCCDPKAWERCPMAPECEQNWKGVDE